MSESPDELLTLPGIAKMLGMQRENCRAAIERGEIPAYRQGKGWRVLRSTLQRHLNERALCEQAERRAAAEARQRASANAIIVTPPRKRGRPARPPIDLSRYDYSYRLPKFLGEVFAAQIGIA